MTAIYQLICHVGFGDFMAVTNSETAEIINLRLTLTNNFFEFNQGQQENVNLDIPIEMITSDPCFAFVPKPNGQLTIGAGLAANIIGYWTIRELNSLQVLEFQFESPNIPFQQYECILVDDIPQSNWSANIKDELYPNFLNLFDRIPWKTIITENQSIILVTAKEPMTNYQICPLQD